jgi:hypothetical protein
MSVTPLAVAVSHSVTKNGERLAPRTGRGIRSEAGRDGSEGAIILLDGAEA